ncbi:hypothetical protein OOK41_13720 [Micromonospora sp. NBC_01655]|uniref:hypothetical protein n=1 Tax=Micromonospora sp. NBC_01655 TaxID=2975983 RepID=UPI0022536924|nr:hypothetical protein [Micromonospora sp. NBC_01655]MCX4471353.1 hypothetical protein [Micromonospora sp. NBC_01655]
MTGSRMRFREIRGEAGRNLGTGTARATILALLTALICTALAALDAISMTGIITAAGTFRDRGASITILDAEHSIDGRACDRLAEQPGVRAAGALAKTDTPLTVAALPQNPLTFFTASPGFATMLPDASGQRTPGLLLPTDVARQLGLRIGDPIHTASGATALGGTYEYPDDGRPRGLGYAAIAPVSPSTRFDQCWIDAYPVSRATIELLYTAIAADATLPESGPTLSQHNQTLGTAIEPAAVYANRMTAVFPLAGLLLGLVTGAGAVWLRRLEIASALHAGIRKTDQASTLLLETAAWATCGALVALPMIAILTQHLDVADHSAVVLTAVQAPTLTAAGALLGTLLAALSIRERRLFTYFKGR